PGREPSEGSRRAGRDGSPGHRQGSRPALRPASPDDHLDVLEVEARTAPPQLGEGTQAPGLRGGSAAIDDLLWRGRAPLHLGVATEPAAAEGYATRAASDDHGCVRQPRSSGTI